MKRRTFIQRSSLAGLPLLVNGIGLTAVTKSRLFSLINGDSDRVLVLIQLNGGNDELNTLIPLDQYDNLAVVRSNVLIPDSQILKISDTAGLHPSMTGMRQLYDAGKLHLTQSVGYPNQNRSHFRSSDIWSTGSAADEVLTTGWMGRYFNADHPNFPDGYPNGDCPDPFALTIGNTTSETCQGPAANFSLAVDDPFNLSPLSESVVGQLPNNCYGDEMRYLVETIKQTNAYSDVISQAANKGANLSTKYVDGNRLAQQLKTIALLVSGGLRTKVYVANLGGFDTHAAQVTTDDPSQGTHALLLELLSSAVEAFQDDLQLLGIDKRVIGMTFSEFGRRIRSNDSLGTDHGTAAPLIVFGSCVNPGILGTNPEVSRDVDVQEGVPMQYDFRSVYGSILTDWFDVDESAVRDLLYQDFQRLPILEPCESTTSQNNWVRDSLEAFVYPNPTSSQSTVQFVSQGGRVSLDLFDALGNQISNLYSGYRAFGEHQVQIELHGKPAGVYYLRLQEGARQRTLRLVKH